MSRRWLIVPSVASHLVVAAGLFAGNVWNLERLRAERLPTQIGVPMPPPPAPGPMAAATEPPRIEHKRKPQIPRETVQPTPRREAAPPTSGPPSDTPPGGGGDDRSESVCTENCSPSVVVAPPAAAACGNGAVEAGEQCDDGNLQSGDGCSASCAREPARPQSMMVSPAVLRGLRIAGDTQPRPSTTTQNQMRFDGIDRATAAVQVCVATSGGVASAVMMKSTNYPDYDAAILAAVRDWRYQPYAVNGTPIRACSTVTFIYSIR
jgi:TonB family protein